MTAVMRGTGEAHPFIIPLTKVDVERRLIIGTAAEETPDKAREIMDYATARPQFESWSKGFSDATGGLSKGNLRVMHTKTVAGRLDDISFDDDGKKVQIVAKVSDDNEWAKVLDGNYTGFSIGGGYLKKWTDDATGLTRYTPIVREISLVDNPCIESARFAELVKADGIVEQLELRGATHTFGALWKAAPPTFAELAKAGGSEWSMRGIGVPHSSPHYRQPRSTKAMIPFMMKPPGDHFRPQKIIGLSTKGKIAAGALGAALTAGPVAGIAALHLRAARNDYKDDTGEHVEQPFQHNANPYVATALGAVGGAFTGDGLGVLANVGSTVRALIQSKGRVLNIPKAHSVTGAVVGGALGAGLGYLSYKRQQQEDSGVMPNMKLRIGARVGDGLRTKVPGAVAGHVLEHALPQEAKAFVRPHHKMMLGMYAEGLLSGNDKRLRTREAQRGYRSEVIKHNGARARGELTEAEHAQRVAAAKARWAKVQSGEQYAFEAKDEAHAASVAKSAPTFGDLHKA